MTATLTQEIAALRETVAHLARVQGDRLTADDMCKRLGISYGTLKTRIKNKQVPAPADHGKWFTSDVIEWEAKMSKEAA